MIPTEDKKLSMGGAIAKSKSYNSFASFRHNDRLIDGPLPSLFERSPSSKRSSTADASTVLPPSSSANGASGLLRAIGAQEEIEGRHQRAGGRISPQPLCFSISGGRPKGRVSWMVMTVPGEETDEGVNMLDPAADWRAIIT